MAKINSKSKGSKNERAIAKLLTLWTGYEFARVPMSGGLGWQNRIQVTGDVIPTDPKEMVKFPFSVEAKFYREIVLDSPLLDHRAKWQDWWDQSCNDAERSGKLPLVFMRRNLMPKDEHYVIVEDDIFDEMSITPSFNNPRGFFNYNHEVVIFPSRDLFRANYKEIEKRLNQLV